MDTDLQNITIEAAAVHAEAASATIEAAADDAAPTLTSNSYNGGLVRVKAYRQPVVVDLDGISNLGQPHPIYRGHDETKILGSGVTERQGNSLSTTGELTNEGEHVDEVKRLGKANYPWQASVGVQPTKLQELRKGQSAVVNDQTITGPAMIARESYLMEVSVVSTGADRTTSTQISAVHPQQETMDMDFEQYVAESGFDAANLSSKQESVLRAAYDSQRSDDSDVQSSVDAVLQAARDKETRSKGYSRIIEAAIDRGMDSTTAERLVEAANADGISETEFELQVLRASRHRGGTHVASRDSATSPLVIEASLARATGFDGLENEYAPEILEASEKAYRDGLTINELMQITARQKGYNSIGSRDIRPLVQAAFAPVQASSGASTYDVAGILSNVANKSLKQGFLSVESSWREIASIQPVRDLKKTSSYALSGDFSYQPVARGGEVKHASMSEEKYENQASTKAILFTIDEDDLINDDLSAFSRVRRLLGRGAAQSLNNVIWEKFLSGVSSGFWGASRNNLITGAASALDVDSLSNARTLFSKQTDPDGAPMGMSPKLLVVPTELEIQADRLVGDREIRIEGATAKTTYTTGNPHAGKFRVVSSAYLNNDLIPNGSATHWFLLGDPMDFATIEVVFLNGQQFPRIENVSLDANQLGIGMRAVHRFGAELHEHRASVMSAGA